MRGKRRAATLALIALTLTACSGGNVASNSTTTEPTAATAPVASPTPAQEAATPQQFASIISGEESGWREVIDGASDCRFLWVMGSDDPADEANGITCYVREATIVMSTGTAAKKLRALTPSSDMEALVEETLAALDKISGTDLEGACGEPFDGPNESKKCSTTQGGLMWAYDGLGTVLDKWKPYT